MTNVFPIHRLLPHFAAAVSILLTSAAIGAACPFCSVESQTLSEETAAADAVVLAKLVREASAVGTSAEAGAGFGAADINTGTAKFEIVEVLHGDQSLANSKEIDVVYFGPPDRDQVFLITGIGTDTIDWITPLPLSSAAIEYVRKLSSVPKAGADRLAFFQDFLEHEDPLLAQDAYEEFARAPYADVRLLGPRMHHDRIVAWIVDPAVSPSRRRLYFTMLSVCGSENDLSLLEQLIVSDFGAKKPFLEDLVQTGLAMGGPVSLPAWVELVERDERRKKLGLDALVACYLTLRGPDGLDLIDEKFLKNPKAEYTYIYSTVMALRFHGDEETSMVPRERLLASMRLLLDNPDFADQVPIDLSRWQDWSVLDRLVTMFKQSERNGYIRQPVVSYLMVASEQPGEVGVRATAALAELEQLDPEGVTQARKLMAFGAFGRARAGQAATTATEPAAAVATVQPQPIVDPTQGFGASAADRQAETESDPAEIPDPTEFETQEPPAEDATEKSDGQAGAGQVQGGDDIGMQSVAEPAAAEAASVDPVVEATPAGKIASFPNHVMNRGLVVGLPLLAAGLLMGVYWAILRFGAM